MARRSSGGRPAAKSAPRPRAAPVRNPPQTAAPAPTPAVQSSGGGGMLSGIGSTIGQGMAFGTGSAMAHRAVDSFVAPRTVQHEVVQRGAGAPAAAPAPASTSGMNSCGSQSKTFEDCLNNYDSDISNCQFYLDKPKERRRGSSSVNF